jgi:predicted PurR-regulated permease PerM
VRGVALGICAGTAVVAAGLWIIWMFRGVFPIWIVLAAVAALIGGPVFEWLEWRVRMYERDRQDGEE